MPNALRPDGRHRTAAPAHRPARAPHSRRMAGRLLAPVLIFTPTPAASLRPPTTPTSPAISPGATTVGARPAPRRSSSSPRCCRARGTQSSSRAGQTACAPASSKRDCRPRRACRCHAARWCWGASADAGYAGCCRGNDCLAGARCLLRSLLLQLQLWQPRVQRQRRSAPVAALAAPPPAARSRSCSSGSASPAEPRACRARPAPPPPLPARSGCCRSCSPRWPP
jgi:hypothetical protein